MNAANTAREQQRREKKRFESRTKPKVKVGDKALKREKDRKLVRENK